jgi:hypothetical protein
MPLPPTRYIDAGPATPLANPQIAAATAKAHAMLGETIARIGERGMQFAEQIRKIDERTKITEFFHAADMQAAEFSQGLMTRNDTEKWGADFRKKVSKMTDDLRKLDLSPAALAEAEGKFLEWSGRRTIQFETQAAAKTVEVGKARAVNAANYYFERGQIEEGRQVLSDGGEAGLFNPAEIEEGQRRGDEIAADKNLAEDLKQDPRGTLARLESGEFLDSTPGADLDMVERGKRKAHAVMQDYRSLELDALEAKLGQGNLKPRDIKAASYLTERDRVALTNSLASLDPPSTEDHAAAWDVLSKLRDARNNPAVSAEKFRELWNDARGDVLQKVAPQWQGDLKKELSYLSPAGRSPDGEAPNTGYERTDLEALGRDVAFRARDAGFFGNLADDATPAEREKAYRKAEDIRLEVKRWISTQKEITPAQVREYTDSLISGDRIKTTAKDLSPFIPGSGQRFRPKPAAAMPPLPPKQGAKDKQNPDPLEIPPGAAAASDELLPARQQLETFIK